MTKYVIKLITKTYISVEYVQNLYDLFPAGV